MGNQCQKERQVNEKIIKGLNPNNEKDQKKLLRTIKTTKDFNRFKELIIDYEYYHKLLKLTFKNNPVLKILYQPESSFSDDYTKIFRILEEITYINYQECIKLAEKPQCEIEEKNDKQKNATLNLNKVKFDLSNSKAKNKPKRNTILSPLSPPSLKNPNMPNIKKVSSFNISNPIKNANSNRFLSYINGEKNLYHELIYIMEKICFYDIKKIQKILLLYPINNLRWILWLAMSRSKYNQIQTKLNISNTEIYNELVNKVEIKDDSLMFELHNTLKELKVFKCNWSKCLYKIIKCLLLYKKDFKYESGMNILIGVPLLISDCNEEDTFFFARYLFSSYYGLGLCYFFGEDELLLNYLVFIVHELTKERFPKIYEHLCKLRIADDLWLKKWIRTFFSSIFDLSITIRVWDCVIAVGIKFLVNFALAIFDYFKDKFLHFKKVKYFLEFFDYELRNRYKKKKDVLLFREKIIRLAQSYNIPDGKYQLLEKKYLSFLFSDEDKQSQKSEVFDTSKTINNYYSSNDSLDDEQYHIKLILRTIIYIPSVYLESNVEDNIFFNFKKKKTTKWLETKNYLNKIEEMEKDSDLSFMENSSSKKSDEKKDDDFDRPKQYSFKFKRTIETKSSKYLKFHNINKLYDDNDVDDNKDDNDDKDSNKIQKKKSMKKKIRKTKSMKSFCSKIMESTDKIFNFNIINNENDDEEKEKEGNNNSDYSSNDATLELSFHEEQMPDYVKE